MGATPPSVRVIESVAQRADVSPLQLSPPLHEAIDLEALNAVFNSTTQDNGTTEVVFEYSEYVVKVVGGDATDVTVRVEDSFPTESHGSNMGTQPNEQS